jgi:hypothetical protein
MIVFTSVILQADPMLSFFLGLYIFSTWCAVLVFGRTDPYRFLMVISFVCLIDLLFP